MQAAVDLCPDVCGDSFIYKAGRRIDMSRLGRVCLLVILVLIAISPLFV